MNTRFLSLLILAVALLSLPNAAAQFNNYQSVCGAGFACVTTYHNDPMRDGVNPNEKALTPTSFTSFNTITVPTDGLVYTQPLYIHNLQGPKLPPNCSTSPANNVAFVGTQNNTVYAINTAGTICWHTNLNNGIGESAIPYIAMPLDVMSYPCTDIVPQIGITGTPVIDVNVTPPAIYVVTSHQITNGSQTTYDQRLHVLRADSGVEVSKISIPTSLAGNYNPLLQNQRAGLALYSPSKSTANLYVAFGSHCDSSNFGSTPTNFYNGWVTGFQINYTNLAKGFSSIGTFTSEPLQPPMNNQGGIWMGGAAPAVDSSGNIYVGVGNGNLSNPPTSSGQWGNSVVKIGSNMVGADYYTPNDWYQLDFGGTVCFFGSCPPHGDTAVASDTDMSTGGVVLLSSTVNPELVSIGKQGMLYVVPYSPVANQIMGGLDGNGYSGSLLSPMATDCSMSTMIMPGYIVQCFEAVNFNPGNNDLNGLRGAPSFWSTGPPSNSSNYNLLFMAGLADFVKAFPLNTDSSKFSATAIAGSDRMGAYPGGGISISWNGSDPNTGVVWVLDTSGAGSVSMNNQGNPVWNAAHAPRLLAYAAVPQGGALHKVFDSKNPPLANMPGSVKFLRPTVADGLVFVAGGVPNYFSSTQPLCMPGQNGINGMLVSCKGQLTILSPK